MGGYVKTFEQFSSSSIEEDIKEMILNASDLVDIFEAFRLQYGNKVPLYHATTKENADIIDKEGLKLVYGNNRMHVGLQENLYCQVGHSDYVNNETRPVLYRFDVSIDFLITYSNADLDSRVISTDTKNYIEQLEEQGVDVETCDFITYFMSNNYKLDGMELLLLDSDGDFPTIRPIKMN